MTLPLPFDRDLASVRSHLFERILTGDFIPFRKPSVNRNRITSRWNMSEDVVSSFIGPSVEILLLVAFENDVRICNRFPGI